ncbi:hypothetical protein ACFQZI_19305 [Mucilaginibacter lutimaris]|uniref:WD40 repeat domain-containing protein n=1 Tax=Mucilaginibacter lutimaris TaxID=931629 RepID=A0ABW2ZLC6_9SPHI
MQPHIELFPLQETPRSRPSDAVIGFYAGPHTTNQQDRAQVIAWGEYVYWVFDFVHNGQAAIVAYNYHWEMVKRWNLQRVRYIWDIEIDAAKKTVTFFGQGGASDTVKLQELCISKKQDDSINPPPVIKILSSAQVPPTPAGLWRNGQTGNPANPGHDVPVLLWENYKYVTYIYPDNRLAFAIIAFDKDGTIVKDWEVRGARYIDQMTLDDANKQVTFTGQSGAKATVNWRDLKLDDTDPNHSSLRKYIQPRLITMPVKAITMPAGLSNKWTYGPNSHDEKNNVLVLVYNDHTYWAFDNKSNDFFICVVAYDSKGNIVKQFNVKGTRYLWSISIDNTLRTITFWGQENMNATISWDQL